MALFVDRGHQLAAARALLVQKGIMLNLKYCTEHIIHNVNAKFAVKADQEQSIRDAISASQSLTTLESYFQGAALFSDLLTGKNALEFILSIHPTNWTVYGNRNINLDEIHMKEIQNILNLPELKTDELFLASNAPVGKKLPLCFLSRNNFTEVENSVALRNGMRKLIPPDAIMCFLSSVSYS